MPIHAPFRGVFGAHFPQTTSLIVLTPKRSIHGLNHVIWAINCEYWSCGSSWACEREKRTGQDRNRSQKGYISPISGKGPTEAMYMKICLVGDVLNVITFAKFKYEIFRGYDFTGIEFSIFPLIFEWALQQCSDACNNNRVYIYILFNDKLAPCRTDGPLFTTDVSAKFKVTWYKN